MVRRVWRRPGTSPLQAVSLIGAAFVVVWGLMTVWQGLRDPLKWQVVRTLNGEPGGAHAKNPGGGGEGGAGDPPDGGNGTPPPSGGKPPADGTTPPAGLTTRPTGTAASVRRMPLGRFRGMTASDRLKWYESTLGPYAADLRASADANGIPQQLLATVILNELSDISEEDVIQDKLLWWSNGSLGIAQINVGTAIAHDLVTYPGDDTSDSGWRGTVRERLKIPPFAIEAAAREIRHQLGQMARNPGNPWQQRFGFTLPGLPSRGRDVYRGIAGGSQLEREQNLSYAIVAAYNSPGIVTDPTRANVDDSPTGKPFYVRGIAHGQNSRLIALELFEAGLFR